jgi:DNA polymerase-3 subunit epsilon
MLRRWLDARRQRGGRWARLFAPYRGSTLVALDLETTGLDTRSCSILSIAAVPLEGRRVELSQAFVATVQNSATGGIEAMRHHRLLPGDVAHGVPIEEALDRLLEYLGNRPILGYAIGFDLAVLNRLTEARHGFRLPNRVVELREVYRARARLARPEHEPDVRFESIMATLGVPVLGRHDAYGDAVTTALAYIAASN